jgi:hypothetical protein
MKLVISGEAGYRGNISQDTYDETEWGTSSDDVVSFTDEAGRSIWIQLSGVSSLNFYDASIPPPGSYELYRVSARGIGRDGVDSLVDQDNRDSLITDLNAADFKKDIVSFNTAAGIEIRLVLANATSIRVREEELVVPEEP